MSRMDNIGAEVTWVQTSDPGTLFGTISVLVSNSGQYFYPLDVTLESPLGFSNGYVVGFNQFPFKYIMFQYVPFSGTGNLYIYMQSRDLN